jgi:hypothetical protein
MATGSQADGLSASFAEGRKAERASVLPYITRADTLLEKASAALVAGSISDCAHFLGNGRQIVSNLVALLRRPGA